MQGFGDLQRHAGRTGKVVGSPQWQNSQAGLGFSECQGFGDIPQGAVAATRNDVPMAGGQGFVDQALSIASFPGQTHVQFPTLLALVCHRITHVFVECLFTVKNEHCPALCHDTSPAEPYELKPASNALCVIGVRTHFARRMTVTPVSRKKPICCGNFFHPGNSSFAPAGTGEKHATGCTDQCLRQD